MKAITFQGVESLAFREVPEPRIMEPGDVVVEVAAAGICGSDLHPYFGRETGLDPGTVMGHEFVGTVMDAGPAVTGLVPGDRVVAPFTTSCGACFYCARGLTARCLPSEWRKGPDFQDVSTNGNSWASSGALWGVSASS